MKKLLIHIHEKILFYNISGTIHSNNTSEILNISEIFSKYVSMSQALKSTFSFRSSLVFASLLR